MKPFIPYLILCFLLLSLTLHFPCHAQTDGKDPRVACSGDAQTFCSDYVSDPHLTRQCLEDHYKQISDECYGALKEAMDSNSEPTVAPEKNDQEQNGPSSMPSPKGDPRRACHQDVQNLCGDIQPGGGRIIQCLMNHINDLSDSCSLAIQNAKQRRN